MWECSLCGVIRITKVELINHRRFDAGLYADTATIMGIAFVVGFIGQYIKLKIDPEKANTNIFWLSVAAGFSAAVTLGFVSEYTDLSPTFLVATAGVVGWGGVTVITSLLEVVNTSIVTTMTNKYGKEKDTGDKK